MDVGKYFFISIQTSYVYNISTYFFRFMYTPQQIVRNFMLSYDNFKITWDLISEKGPGCLPWFLNMVG